MRLHILGICGTFMGGIAALARELGHTVEGSDANVYPPRSTQLEQLGITLKQGFKAEHLEPAPDLVVVGNALSRGNAAIEHMLDARLRYVSGPQWLGETLLADRRVLAVAGTHGKTTTTSLLAWILESQGRAAGFLVGGVPANFGVSARVGSGSDFVIEADEYDTAFFDKRSKFVHYRPGIAILNNLEYDHADIFPDVAAIQRQFHHLVRTVPGNGRLIVNAEDARLAEVLAMGCWTPVETFGIDAGDWRARLLEADGSAFVVSRLGHDLGNVCWNLSGRHNVMNALAALAAASVWGIGAAEAKRVFRTLVPADKRGEVVRFENGLTVINDSYNSSPTALNALAELLAATPGYRRRILAAGEMLELGTSAPELHRECGKLAGSLAGIDWIVGVRGDAAQLVHAAIDAGHAREKTKSFESSDEAAKFLAEFVTGGDLLLLKGSRGVKMEKILDAIDARHKRTGSTATVVEAIEAGRKGSR